MKRGIIFFALAWIGCSESKTDEGPWVNICPDLAWLESLKGSIQQSGNKGEIYLTRYKEQRVFEVNPCVECADIVTTVHDCEGNVVCEFGGISGLNTCPDYSPNPSTKLLFWKN